MIIVSVTYTMKQGRQASDFLRELEDSGFAPYCRTENGNSLYQYYCPADGSNRLYLLEKWKDEGCLKTHMATENFAKISRLTDVYAENMDMRTVDTGI